MLAQDSPEGHSLSEVQSVTQTPSRQLWPPLQVAVEVQEVGGSSQTLASQRRFAGQGMFGSQNSRHCPPAQTCPPGH